MNTRASRWPSMRKTLVTLFIVALLILAARYVQQKVGIKLSADSIQQTVGDLGLLAPVGYVLLTMFRQLFALPSMLLLTSGGLLFGAPMGTLLGGIGITLNAFTLFAVARMSGRDWVLPKLQARYAEFEARSKTAGPWLIALMTGHPVGVLTPFHLAAGVTGITALTFLLAVGPAGVFRAACYSFLGANLLQPDSPGLWGASAVLVLAALLPLAHPARRAQLLRGQKKSGDPKTGSPP